jgi:hypothetical protein
MTKETTTTTKTTTKVPLAPPKTMPTPTREKTTAEAPKDKNTQRSPDYSAPVKGK